MPLALACALAKASGIYDVALRVFRAADDVVIVTQKIVSKAEGRIVEVPPHDDDARHRVVELEAARIVRRRGNLIIAETRHGFVCASAGVDASNAPEPGALVLLPRDPDASAALL